jgi:hypothetical protein
MNKELYTVALDYNNSTQEYNINLNTIINTAKLFINNDDNNDIFCYIVNNLDTLIHSSFSIEYDMTIDTEDLSIDSEDMLKCIADILNVEFNIKEI